MNQSRYEKEIEEILRKAGEETPGESPQGSGEPPRRRRRNSPARRRVTLPRFAFGYKVVLLAGIVAIAVAALANIGGLYLFLVGVALLVAGYVMYYRAPRSGGVAGGAPSPRMWRGRRIDPDDPPGPRER